MNQKNFSRAFCGSLANVTDPISSALSNLPNVSFPETERPGILEGDIILGTV